MDLGALYRLEATGGLTLERYRELLAQGDAAASDSPAANALAVFCKQWETNPTALTAAVERESAEPEVRARAQKYYGAA
jgi:hypothetical protein